MFKKDSHVLVYGFHVDVVQKMLDFDFLCDRSPSVVAIVDPSRKKQSAKVFFGDKEILIPVVPSLSDVHEETQKKGNIFLNFASFRSAYESTKIALTSPYITTIVIVAEWIPEHQTRELIALAKKAKKHIIGPATVGGLVSGKLRLWNTGGSLENIISSRLFQKGSVGVVTKSGGMSNEMRKILAKTTDGSHTSIALGGDRYTGMRFSDVLLEFEKNSEIRMIVMLGEVGGTDELEVSHMIEAKIITKPVVAYCIGTISDSISTEIQFGHAGAKAGEKQESAVHKNRTLKKAWAIVPWSFLKLGEKIAETFDALGIPKNGDIPENILEKKHRIENRTPTKFVSTISDERGEELHYNRIPLSNFLENRDIGEVIGHLWFQKNFPPSVTEFFTTVIILLADHGPAVSGATNAIVTARWGNDIKSSLIAGLSTVWPRFGGAIDASMHYFYEACQNNTPPEIFVADMKKKGIPIPGIGHKIKSKFNPDTRCQALAKIAQSFPDSSHLEYALEVEKITLDKKPNLILNVDGYIATMLLDILTSEWFSSSEIREYIDIGIGNAFFLFSRSIGFIGHAIDQKRLGEPLYRTPWEDILYLEE